MSPLQQSAVDKLVKAGFTIIVEAREIVRLTKGADRRIVMPDGTQKRASHTER